MHVMNLLKAGQVCVCVCGWMCVLVHLMFPALSEAISSMTQIFGTSTEAKIVRQ